MYRRQDNMSEDSMDRIGVLSSLSHHCAARIDALAAHLSENDIEHVESFIQGLSLIHI